MAQSCMMPMSSACRLPLRQTQRPGRLAAVSRPVTCSAHKDDQQPGALPKLLTMPMAAALAGDWTSVTLGFMSDATHLNSLQPSLAVLTHSAAGSRGNHGMCALAEKSCVALEGFVTESATVNLHLVTTM